VIGLSLSAHQTLIVESSVAILRGGEPILNGRPLDAWSCEVLQVDRERIELRYTARSLGDGVFRIQATRAEALDRVQIRYWMEGLPADLILDSFGLRFEQVENVRQYLRNGYFSWDGSFYVQPGALTDFDGDLTQLETGYGMCQILPRHGSGSMILGFARHDRFQQTFTFDLRHQPPALTIQTWWDRKDRSGQEKCESEELVIFAHAEIENGLREWAHLAAKASPRPPRLSSHPITGWCSWYNLYAYINEENILEHLRAAQTVATRDSIPLRIFQIDDGFTPEMGDWLEVKPQFPRGMRPLLVQVRQPRQAEEPGAIFFLNTASHMLQRSYPLAELGIKDPVSLYHWENRSASDESHRKISMTLPAHHSALYFFSHQPIRDLPLHFPR